MFLAGPRMEGRTLRAALAPWADGVKVRGRTPLVTPWRTIQIADRVEDLTAAAADAEPEPAEQARRRFVDRPAEVRRDLVGDAPEHDDVVVGAQARRDDGEHAEVHRLRRRERLQGRARRGMEHRLGRRLDREQERLHVHEGVSGLRSARPRRVREVEGRRAHRAQRDVGRHRELRAPARGRVSTLPVARHPRDQDGLRRRHGRWRAVALRRSTPCGITAK